jgi:hypothetical protein
MHLFKGVIIVFYFIETVIFSIPGIHMLIAVLFINQQLKTLYLKISLLIVSAVSACILCYVSAKNSLKDDFSAEDLRFMCILTILSAFASLYIHKRELL